MSRQEKLVRFAQHQPTTCLTVRKIKRNSNLEELLGFSSADWAVIANAITAFSFFLTFIGLCFVGYQIREQKKANIFEGNFKIMEKITVQFDNFCAMVSDGNACESDSESVAGLSDRAERELVNLLALFEYVSYMLNKKMVDRKKFNLVERHIIDLIEKICHVDDCVEIIKNYRDRDDVYEEIVVLISRNRCHFSSYFIICDTFQIPSIKPPRRLRW